MNPAEVLLEEVRTRGISIYVVGENLRIRAEKGALDEALMERIRAHKAELRTLLSEPAASDGTCANGQKRQKLQNLDRDSETVLEERQEPIAWRLYSRVLSRELWVCRDQRTAAEIWAETALPTLTVGEWLKLERLSLEVLEAVLRARASFGPSVEILAVREVCQ